MNAAQHDLFPERNSARYGDGPPSRRLFLHRYLEAAAGDKRLAGKAQDRAYEIILKWADMEAGGKLKPRKETALHGEFLRDVFGEALGYTFFSENLDQWHIDPEFSVPGGQADAAIGSFRHDRKEAPRVLIELKDPTVNLDRDRSAGRTPVQQLWDYLNAVPECPWGIVCNYVSFRLYHRNKTLRTFELFTLQELRSEERFRRFYCIFERGGLFRSILGQASRAERLLTDSDNRQREVGGELYESYHLNRIRLIEHLSRPPHSKPLEASIGIAQKLLDRIVFVAFCEDRGLLPEESIRQAWRDTPPFTRVTNPRWRNFRELFRSVDEGNPAFGIPPYNGGLLQEDPEVDDLDLDDRWTDFFKDLGSYDFRDEVNLDVLGHLFEQSINDLERLRVGGLFGEKTAAAPELPPSMPKSAQRKRSGIYYTPLEFTEFIARNTVGKVIAERFEEIGRRHGVTPKEAEAGEADPKLAEYWEECLDALRRIRIVDPACGSGAFLMQAYEVMEAHYKTAIYNLSVHEGLKPDALFDTVPDVILRENLFGVDLSPEGVEITQLALWIRSARPGKALSDLSGNIVCGNSLVDDPDVHPMAMNWRETFPNVFSGNSPGFDCVIGNPPWERMKLQEREFFDLSAPKIASAVNAATRRKLIRELEEQNPELHRRYVDAKEAAEQNLDYVRGSGRFPLTGKGDVNTYAVFAELAREIVAPNGRVGLLVPSGIATDHTTRGFFADLVGSRSLIGLYDFENKAPVFPDVHRSFKFSVLLAGGPATECQSADFVFFARELDDLKDPRRHIPLTRDDLKLLNPNTRTSPVFRSRRDAELTKAVYRRVPVLIDETRSEGGNPWGVRFLRMFDQTNAAELFATERDLREMGFARKPRAAGWQKGKTVYLPLYEAKMVQAYDHRAAGIRIERANWMRQGQTRPTTLVEHQNPEFTVEPRWWVNQAEVQRAVNAESSRPFIGFKDITSPTNQRTMIAAAIPWSAVTNHFPLVITSVSPKREMCLLANLNSFILDFIARQKIGGITLNFFIVRQLPVLPPDAYAKRCPWKGPRKLETWISERVLKLSCTSNDMRPLAQAAGFRPGVHKWDPEERSELQAELDAAYFILYGIERSDVEYVLSTFSGAGQEGSDVFGSGSAADRILKHYDLLRGLSAP